MGLKGKLAGQILGPRPGLMIVSFFGGRIEILLRILAPLVGSLPALIAAAIALSTLKDFPNIDSSAFDGTELGDLRDDTYAATGVVIAVTALAIIIEVLMIILRFLNIGLVNLKIKIFLIIDIVISCVLAGGHFVGGILQAFYGNDWNDDEYSGSDRAERIYMSMVASAVFCFIGTALFIILALFMIIFMIKDWNSKVVKATVKDAVTG